MHVRNVPIGADQLDVLPPPVQQLAGREREVASKLYLHGPMTAEAILEQLSSPLSNSAIRTMLSRLCDKGILTRRKRSSTDSTGRRLPFVYVPAISAELTKRRALEQLAADYFEGSLLFVLRTAVEILDSDGRAPAPVRRKSRQAPSNAAARVNLAA